MQEPVKRNITRKLVLSSCLLILIFLLFGIYSLYGIRTISGLTRTIYDHPLVVSNAALQAAGSITKMHRNMKDLVLFETPSRIQQSIAAVDEQEQLVYQHLDIVRDRILGDEGKRLEVGARTLFDHWRPIREEVIGLVREGDRESAAEITIGKGADHVARLEARMLGLTEYARTKATSFMAATERAHATFSLSAFVFLLLGIGLSTLVTFFTLKGAGSTERELRKSENRQRAILDATPFPVAVVDLEDDRIFYWSRSAFELFGHTASTTPEWYEIAYPDPEYRADVIRRWKLARESARTSTRTVNMGEYRVRCKDGSERICELYATFLPDSLIVTFDDISERRKSEQALKENHQLILKSQRMAKLGNWKWDVATGKVEWSEEVYRIFGLDPEDFEPQVDSIMDRFHPEDQRHHEEAMQEAINNREHYSYESRILLPDQSIRTLFSITEGIFDEYGNLTHVTGVVQDVTDLKKAEEEKQRLESQLKQSQKMESIGTLAGGIAHDFNNILASIIGFTELALDDAEMGTTLADNLQEVFTAGHRAKELVKQILAFARQSDEEVKPIRIDRVAEEVLRLVRSSIPTTIEIKPRIDTESLIMGNHTQIHQVLMNLCTNAAHAMEATGGVLDVSLTDVAIGDGLGPVGLGLRKGDYIRIAVSDTGIGIAPDIIDSVFEPYFTTKDPGEGTGMGLAVVLGIVETYGGKITLDTGLGQGTTFTVYIPTTGKSDAREPYESAALPCGSERILFVDDEAALARMGERLLSSLGYSVTMRTSSIEALELFRAKPDDFDLVITDMTMPNLTGSGLSAELIKIRSDIPVILCTGYSKSVSEASATEIGIRALAYKPIVRAELARTVRQVLDAAAKGS